MTYSLFKLGNFFPISLGKNFTSMLLGMVNLETLVLTGDLKTYASWEIVSFNTQSKLAVGFVIFE